ncbi:hypothetical protein BGZ83_002647 [Gryganskiella cystojenkinii]|nr:hypothetical protein BGZ83_002647 [Gryganskiella cystojenkinii]
MATATTTSSTGPQTSATAIANSASAVNGGLANGTANNNSSNSNSTEVWSSLLKSVASSRLVPSKDVIILGDPHSGKSTLIDLLKTAQPTLQDPLANGLDGKSGVITPGGVAVGPNGAVNGSGPVNGVVATASNNGNGSAPVMVEMGTGTSEDNMFAGAQHKSDLALSYSFWNVEDDENEDTVARLGIYQIAGSHKSYHALLKYCLNSKTVADSVVMIVLDWSRPWTFMESLERWIKVLESAVEGICQEGSVSTAANWSKGKALMEELQEKLGRYLQEYVEPQPHPATGSAIFNDNQSFALGATDPQSVLLPLAEGCLTSNTGIPIIVVCTKSDHINNLEREMDYQEETFDYIQQSLRTICLKYGASLFYTSIHHPHTFANLRQYILHRLLTPSSLNNPQQQPSSSPFKRRAQVVERDQVMVPAGWDSIGKIKVLRNGFDCEGVSNGWEFDQEQQISFNTPAESEYGRRTRTTSGAPESARHVYEEVIINPKLSHAPVTIQPLITAEDDQVFLDRFFETLQRANERVMAAGGGAGMGSGAGSHHGHGSVSEPPVVGPLGSGYNAMLNSHHPSSPPPVSNYNGASGRGGLNGYGTEDVEGQLRHLASKPKINGVGSSSGLLGPSLTETAGGSGMSNKTMAMMMDQIRANPGSPSVSSLGGMVSSSASLTSSSSVISTAGRSSAVGVGGTGAPIGTVGPGQHEAIHSFFQGLMNRNGKPSVLPVGGPGASTTAAGAAGTTSPSAGGSQ